MNEEQDDASPLGDEEIRLLERVRAALLSLLEALPPLDPATGDPCFDSDRDKGLSREEREHCLFSAILPYYLEGKSVVVGALVRARDLRNLRGAGLVRLLQALLNRRYPARVLESKDGKLLQSRGASALDQKKCYSGLANPPSSRTGAKKKRERIAWLEPDIFAAARQEVERRDRDAIGCASQHEISRLAQVAGRLVMELTRSVSAYEEVRRKTSAAKSAGPPDELEPLSSFADPIPFVVPSEAAQQVRDCIRRSTLAILTGPGGAGKTCLAIHLARQIASEKGCRGWYLRTGDARRLRRCIETLRQKESHVVLVLDVPPPPIGDDGYVEILRRLLEHPSRITLIVAVPESLCTTEVRATWSVTQLHGLSNDEGRGLLVALVAATAGVAEPLRTEIEEQAEALASALRTPQLVRVFIDGLGRSTEPYAHGRAASVAARLAEQNVQYGWVADLLRFAADSARRKFLAIWIFGDADVARRHVAALGSAPIDPDVEARLARDLERFRCCFEGVFPRVRLLDSVSDAVDRILGLDEFSEVVVEFVETLREELLESLARVQPGWTARRITRLLVMVHNRTAPMGTFRPTEFRAQHPAEEMGPVSERHRDLHALADIMVQLARGAASSFRRARREFLSRFGRGAMKDRPCAEYAAFFDGSATLRALDDHIAATGNVYLRAREGNWILPVALLASQWLFATGEFDAAIVVWVAWNAVAQLPSIPAANKMCQAIVRGYLPHVWRMTERETDAGGAVAVSVTVCILRCGDCRAFAPVVRARDRVLMIGLPIEFDDRNMPMSFLSTVGCPGETPLTERAEDVLRLGLWSAQTGRRCFAYMAADDRGTRVEAAPRRTIPGMRDGYWVQGAEPNMAWIVSSAGEVSMAVLEAGTIAVHTGSASHLQE